MQIDKNKQDGVLTLALSGDFDTTDVERFMAEVSEAVDEGSVLILLDLGDLRFLNSTALGTLLRSQKLLAQYEGGLVAARPTSIVEKTIRILELDRRIPLFAEVEDARAHLTQLTPESVFTGGEEVRFLVATVAFGLRPRVGRMEELTEGGAVISFDILDNLNVDHALVDGSSVNLNFRLPQYHPTHLFNVDGTIESHEIVGRETVFLKVAFTSMPDEEWLAVRQYVKDMRELTEEGI